MKYFLDDQLEERKSWIPEGYVGVRNFEEFRRVLEGGLERGERLEGLSFDNDLGEGEKEGWEIAKWLTEVHPEIFAQNPELRAHSQNFADSGGGKKIEQYFELGRSHWRELVEAKERPNPWAEMERKI